MSYSTVTRAQVGQGLVSSLYSVKNIEYKEYSVKKENCLQNFFFLIFFCIFVKYTKKYFSRKGIQYFYGSRFGLFGGFSALFWGKWVKRICLKIKRLFFFFF